MFSGSKFTSHGALRLSKIEELAVDGKKIKEIDCGLTIVVLLDDGTLYATGDNWHGELANGFAAWVDGSSYGGTTTFNKIDISEKIDKISINEACITAVSENGNLYMGFKISTSER